MSILFDIILLLVCIWFLPYIIVGVLIGKVLTELNNLFFLPVLWGAFAASGLAVMAWFNRIPDDSRPFSSIIEVLAQSTIAGLQMPYVLAGFAVVLFVMSSSKTWRKTR